MATQRSPFKRNGAAIGHDWSLVTKTRPKPLVTNGSLLVSRNLKRGHVGDDRATRSAEGEPFAGPRAAGSRLGYERIQEAFGPGAASELQVVVPGRKALEARAALLERSDIAAVTSLLLVIMRAPLVAAASVLLSLLATGGAFGAAKLLLQDGSGKGCSGSRPRDFSTRGAPSSSSH